MRQIDNWDAIEERQPGEYDQPAPGGYIAVIEHVEDAEDREYLSIEWDFAEGSYQGANQGTYDRAGFWPCRLFRSYKESALGFFKAFKTSVEASNPGYLFQTSNPRGLEGKRLGVVLGEEEYRKRDGTVGTRLYVHQTHTVEAIRAGDFKLPALKRLPGPDAFRAPAARPGGFAELSSEDDGELPF